MRKFVYFDAVKADCVNASGAWSRNPDLQIPGIDREGFDAKVDEVTRRNEEIATRERELASLKEERNDGLRILNDHCNALRLAAKLHYGVDSIQYGAFGGTRGFLRKTAQRTATSDSSTVSFAKQN